MFATLLYNNNKYHHCYLFCIWCSFIICSLSSTSCDHGKQATTTFAKGSISQEVYVWQRVWTPEVKEAVISRAPTFNATTLLAAEIDFSNQQWTTQPFSAPLTYAQNNSLKFALAFRIHSNAAKSRWSKSAIERVTQIIRHYSTYTKTIQVDYDCPSKKLSDYALFVAHLKAQFPDKKIEITCLPDWLNYPEFSDLVSYTDRFIMQVHGVSGHGKGRALCNPDAAYEVALTCSKFQKPYLIALPTYRHAVSYNDKEVITNIASEGHYQYANYEIAAANPHQLAELMKRWHHQRPQLMEGIIWYRLPVDTDRMNWTWSTLQQVRQGNQPPQAKPEFIIDKLDDGNHTISITNPSQQHLEWPEKIYLTWQGFSISQRLTKAYTTQAISRNKNMILKWNHKTPYPISPGETIKLGSLRFTNPSPAITIEAL